MNKRLNRLTSTGLCFLLILGLSARATASGLRPVDESLQAVGFNGTTYHVSPGGNDANDGRSPAQPLRTLQAAANRVQPGDTILAHGGIYDSVNDEGRTVTLERSGTPTNWIRMIHAPGENPFIEIEGVGGIRVKGAHHILIEGFTIIGRNDRIDPDEATAFAERYDGQTRGADVSFSTGISVDRSDDAYSHHVILRNNTIQRCSGNGIGIKRADYVLVEHNRVFENAFYSPWGTSGISVWSSWNFDHNTENYRTVIRNNLSYRNYNRVKFWMMRAFTDGNGIIIDALINSQSEIVGDGYALSFSGWILIANNVCFENGGRGINLFESDRIDIINNTLYKNSRHPELHGEIGLGDVNQVRLYGNIIHGSRDQEPIFEWRKREGDGGYEADFNLIRYPRDELGIPWGENSVVGDPLFVDVSTGDFRLQPGSIAIDAGSPTLYDPTDFAGRVRPTGRAPDMGAFEQ